ncbi:uracil-DNA glycosylase [Accumulibacter sp.]|uniref:uracil-DNA glycosylase n=1 Tax=Accumulibacter sp. TaxID=2053492 RepID=UPI0035AF836E
MSAGNSRGTGLTRWQLLNEMGLPSQWRLREQAALRRGGTAAFAGPPAATTPAASEAMAAVPVVAAAADAPSPPAVSRSAGPPDDDREQQIARLDWDGLRDSVAGCRACALCQERRQAVLGVGDTAADWLFIGEGPGAEEDLRGEPFVGPAGKLLDAMLAAIDLQRGENVYIANAVKCRPPGNRTPEAAEMATCAPYLRRQITLIQPRLIVLLGRAAAHAVLGDVGSLASLRGQTFEYREADGSATGIPVIVSYHPAYLLRTLQDKAKAWDDLCRARTLLRTATTSAALPA